MMRIAARYPAMWKGALGSAHRPGKERRHGLVGEPGWLAVLSVFPRLAAILAILTRRPG
jgi:hypothetical protein